jgi:DnaJ family protein C protein 1
LERQALADHDSINSRDHEIFDLVGALETAEGKGTSFYSFLNVTPTANLDQINKAYRKRSLALQ